MANFWRSGWIASGVGALLCCGMLCQAASADEKISPQQATAEAVDQAIEAKLKAEGISAAPLADDSEFVRRVYLDLCGVTPRVAEVRNFLADSSPDKRVRLVRQLLASPLHATHQANTWRNLLLPGSNSPEQLASSIGVQNWLQQRFAEKLRYDNLVSEFLVATTGDEVGPAAYYNSLERAPEKLAASTARIFLGLQIECAECHDHPFDHWKQKDFWGYAAFFARLQRTDGMPVQPNAAIVELPTGEVTLPNKEETIAPKYPVTGAEHFEPRGSRRQQLAIWMASRDNPYLAQAAVNRIWSQLFGRGLVEPLDDFSPKNPASHPEVLEILSKHFIAENFDLNSLYETLILTRAYQRTSLVPEGTPQPAPELFAVQATKVLTPEQLFDSLSRVVGMKAAAGPNMGGGNSRLADQRRQMFLGKMAPPARSPVEYSAGVLQALARMNSPEASELTNPDQSPVLAAMRSPLFSDEERLEILFLATLARKPDEEERKFFMESLESAPSEEKPKILGDCLWALLSSAEFVVNH